MPATGKTIASTSRNPPAVAAKASAVTCIRYRLRWQEVRRGIGAQRDAPGLLKKPQHQRDRERAGREGDDNAGDHHRLRHGIGGEPGCRASPRDDAEQQENAAADKIEGENLAQRLRIGDEAIKAKTDQRRADEPGQRCRAHRRGARRGGPATSIGRVTAMDSVMKASMKRISGLANPAG